MAEVLKITQNGRFNVGQKKVQVNIVRMTQTLVLITKMVRIEEADRNNC